MYNQKPKIFGSPNFCWQTLELRSKSDTNERLGGKNDKAFKVRFWFSGPYLVPADLSSIPLCERASGASGGTETSHSLCSFSKIIDSVKAATYCDGGSFYLQARS